MENNTNIVTIVQSSALQEQTKNEIQNTFTPYMARIQEMDAKLSAVISQMSEGSEPLPEDIKMAEAIRKTAKATRLDAEKTKKQGKEDIIAKGRVYDAVYNLIESTSKLIESKANQIEKYYELKEKARLDGVEFERRDFLRQEKYAQFDVTFVAVREMSEEQWDSYVAQLDATLKAQAEAEAKAKEEAERIEMERIEAEKKREAERVAQLKAAEEARKLAEKKLAEEQKARAEAEAKARAEREKLEAEQKAERERLQAIAKKQQEEADRLRAEAEAKVKAEREVKEKAEAEIKARAKADDAVKLNHFVNQLKSIEFPLNLKDEKNIEAVNQAKQRIDAIINYFNNGK